MKSINGLVKKLMNAFKNKEYRHAYVDEYLNLSIATQIKVLREQRKWGQSDLAEKVGMKQPRISVMENVNYSSWSINTLRKLAKAFDLTLRVSFESFGSRVENIDRFNQKALERPSFEDDPVFIEAEEEEVEKKITAASKALPDTEEKQGFETGIPLFSVVPAPIAGAFQVKSKQQMDGMVPKQRNAHKNHIPWWETSKRATA